LHSSTRSLFACIVLLALTCSAQATADERKRCIEKITPSAEVTRFDEKASRVFLVSDTLSPEEFAKTIPTIAECMEDLGDDWALSLFRAVELAGYKDDPSIVEFHKGNRWAKGYVAEYLHAEHELTAWPVTDPHVIPVPEAAL
jgi:hypothetical protein